jgi:hypothetical protein
MDSYFTLSQLFELMWRISSGGGLCVQPCLQGPAYLLMPLPPAACCHCRLLPLLSPPAPQVLSSVLGMRDPRQLSEPLNPRYMRMVKDTVKGMRVRHGAGSA